MEQRLGGDAFRVALPLPRAPGSMANRPYLSIVTVSRNDDHGGNLLGRMQLFVDGLAEQCHRHGLKCELILVEWNPPTDRPRLAEALRWSKKPTSCNTRIVVVAPEVHGRFQHADKLPLFQMIAKNVGVRRARGQFVLATNIDILFSVALMEHLARRPLVSGKFYRVDRYDVPSDVPADTVPEERLAWCADHAFRVARRDGIYVRKSTDPGAPFKRAALSHPGMVWARMRELAAAESGAAVWRYTRGATAIGVKVGQKLGILRAPMRLHTNASGDFTLMARDDWWALRGYPEFEMYSWHIDAVLLYHASRCGFAEVVWESPLCIYHVEHGEGSGWTPEGHKALFERLERRGVPHLTETDFEAIIRRLRAGPTDITFNGSDWGLADDDLEEIRPH